MEDRHRPITSVEQPSFARVVAATRNSLAGVRDGFREASVRQEVALLVAGIPIAFLIATTPWVFVALVGSLLLLLAVEYLNTAVEKLCDHVTPERHEAIRMTKDLGSAAVLFAILIAALAWGVAILDRLGAFG